MTRRQKIVVVAVLAAIVVLYVAAVAGGGRSGEGDATHPGELVNWLGRLAGKPPAVAHAELRADCLAENTFTVKGSCTVNVARSGKDVRELKLHAQQALSITARAPHGDSAVTADVKAGDDVKVTVDGDGGDVVVNCGDPSGTCVATLT
jgi:hypothetical protein